MASDVIVPLRVILLHPLVCIVGIMLLYIWTAGFTSGTSVLRPISFIIISGWVGMSISWSRVYVDSTGFAARVLGGMMFTIPLSFLGRLLIQRYSIEQERRQGDAAPPVKNSTSGSARHGRSLVHTRSATFKQRLTFGFETAGQIRGQDIRDKRSPPFSRYDPTYVPSFQKLLFTNAASLLFCLVVHDYAVDCLLILNGNSTSISRIDAFAPWLVTLQNPSLIKMRSTLAYWVIQYSMLEIQHCLSTVIGLLRAPKELENCRPLFGSVFDAYTVRRFWG